MIALVDGDDGVLEQAVDRLWDALCGRRKHRKKNDEVPPIANVLIYSGRRIALRCLRCNGFYFLTSKSYATRDACPDCEGVGFIGIDGSLPSSGPQGSESKVAMLVARYAQGLPLWHPGDQIGVTDDQEKMLAREVERNDRKLYAWDSCGELATSA
jgi:hypothetical protein